jgi:hypothetical protein
MFCRRAAPLAVVGLAVGVRGLRAAEPPRQSPDHAGVPLNRQSRIKNHESLPLLFPDYVGITLPPNIAPLNFKIQEPGAAYRVELRSTKGPPIAISSREPAIRIPPRAWASLLRANPGEPFYWDIEAQTASSGWTRFATVTNQIAREEMDGWLAYRLLKPIFNFYVHLGIYQRNLESFEQRPILEKEKYDEGCLNCHMPLNRGPDTFAFHIRAHAGKNPMILVVSNQAARVERTMGYLAWHPSGRLVVFSAGKLSLLYHTRGEACEVYDASSDLGVYNLDSNIVAWPPAIAAPDRNETWPAWSPDGRYLYFSSAVPKPMEKLKELRYDLMRVSFDIQTGQWGKPEPMISSAETGQSVLEPKVSPDGRWLLVTLCHNGHFPIYHPESDLYVMDLAARKLRRLDINSDQADTWHSWSSNSRWVVFSSKRIDGLLARPHFSYVDEHGEFHKPFVLPQEDPSFYGFCLNTFNVPEFMQGPVTIKERELARAVTAPRKVLTPEGPGRPGAAEAGAQPHREDTGYGRGRE